MPNVCESDLYVFGLMHELEQFFARMKGDETHFDFNRLIPYPEHFENLDAIAEEWDKSSVIPRINSSPEIRPKDGFNHGGREWCDENWGTKWNAFKVTVPTIDAVEESCLEDIACGEVSFSTAWLPPLPVIKKASEQFPSLCFVIRYFERGAAFQGAFAIKGGKTVQDEKWEYDGNRGG